MSSKLHVGDLVTRTYDYTVDSIPEVSRQLQQKPYGIVLEIKSNDFKGNNESVVVYWFKEESAYTKKRRVNNSRFLRVVNSIHSE